MVSLSNHQPPERASFDKLRMSGKNGYVMTLQSSYGLTRTHFATVAVPGKRQSADTAPLPLLPTRPYYLTTNHHFSRLIANRLIANRLIANRLIANRLIANRLIANRLIANRLIANRLIANRLIANRLIANRLIANRLIAQPPDRPTA